MRAAGGQVARRCSILPDSCRKAACLRKPCVYLAATGRVTDSRHVWETWRLSCSKPPDLIAISAVSRSTRVATNSGVDLHTLHRAQVPSCSRYPGNAGNEINTGFSLFACH